MDGFIIWRFFSLLPYCKKKKNSHISLQKFKVAKTALQKKKKKEKKKEKKRKKKDRSTV